MPFALFRWEQASLLFFSYVLVCALLLRGLSPAARVKSATGSFIGLAIVLFGAAIQPASQIWRGLLLPALALLIAYWSSGLLFRAPSAAVEAFLRHADAILRIRETAASAPRVTAEFLEFAYAAVYALVPVALVLYLLETPSDLIDVDRFWTVVLATDFICFGMLPWIQSRPPRAVEEDDPWRSSFRRFNLRVLGSTSIQVNTCPSGHAAEALVAALLVSSAPAPIFVAVLFAAAAVSAGAVYGRYHYALDVVSGWAVALVVWALL